MRRGGRVTPRRARRPRVRRAAFLSGGEGQGPRDRPRAGGLVEGCGLRRTMDGRGHESEGAGEGGRVEPAVRVPRSMEGLRRGHDPPRPALGERRAGAALPGGRRAQSRRQAHRSEWLAPPSVVAQRLPRSAAQRAGSPRRVPAAAGVRHRSLGCRELRRDRRGADARPHPQRRCHRRRAGRAGARAPLVDGG